MKYDTGDVITYRAFGGEIRKVLVIGKVSNIKNGLGGFDGLIIKENGDLDKIAVWGYDYQVVEVTCK